MSEESDIGRDDIPSVEVLKSAILAELDSGRARSFETVQSDAASSLHLSTRQRRYTIKGSKTALLANRFEKARAELKAEGLIEYPAHGKMKLTAAAKKPSSDESARNDKKHAAIEPAGEAGKHAAGPSGSRKRQQAPHAPQSPAPAPETAPGDSHPAPTTDAPGAAPEKPDAMPAHAETTSMGAWAKYRKYAPAALVVLGIILCLAQLGLPGAILGGAGLFLRSKDSRSDSADNPAAPKATLWAGVASVLLGLVLAVASCTGSSPSASTDRSDAPASPPASTQEADESANGVLSFKVTATGWPDKNKPVQVSVEGKTTDGKAVSDHYEAFVGTAYALEYGAGSYTISVAQGSLVCDNVPFTTSPSQCTFDGAKDRLITLNLAKDEKALSAAQEAEKQKEAEAAAKAEAEAAAKAEAEAAAQAEAERQAAEEAAAAAAAAAAVAQAESAAVDDGGSSGGGEYIGNVNSYKFHVPSCRTLPKEKNRIYFSSRDEAINSGYVPCKNCNP